MPFINAFYNTMTTFPSNRMLVFRNLMCKIIVPKTTYTVGNDN